MKQLSLLCWALAWSVSARAADLEFKGLALDSVVTPEQVTEGLKVACYQAGEPCDAYMQKIQDSVAVKCGSGLHGKQICNGQTTIADERATANIVIGADRRLERILLTISSDAYEVVIEKLRKKYGKPSTVKRSKMQNGFGATFTQIDTFWSRANGCILSVSKYAYNTENSTIYFSSRADRAPQPHNKPNSNDL